MLCASLLSFPSPSGIARCFTFGGSKKRVLHDPAIRPRTCLSKQEYMNKDEQTTVNHFHEKLLKIKDLMKTKVEVMEYLMWLSYTLLFLISSICLLVPYNWKKDCSEVWSQRFGHEFQAGQRRAEKRHKFMEEFLKEFYDEWDGKAWLIYFFLGQNFILRKLQTVLSIFVKMQCIQATQFQWYYMKNITSFNLNSY